MPKRMGENGSGGTAQTGENAGNGEDLQVEGTEAVRQEETETPDVSGTEKRKRMLRDADTGIFVLYPHQSQAELRHDLHPG